MALVQCHQRTQQSDGVRFECVRIFIQLGYTDTLSGLSLPVIGNLLTKFNSVDLRLKFKFNKLRTTRPRVDISEQALADFNKVVLGQLELLGKIQ